MEIHEDSYHHHSIQSFVAVQETRWPLQRTFANRIWSLDGRTLTMTTAKRDFRVVAVKQGLVWSGTLCGIQIESSDGKWFRGTLRTKAEWGAWVQAFHDMARPTTAPLANKRATKVHFANVVHVRTIPGGDTTEDEDDDDHHRVG
ncbi:Aste57867_8137 [Aphanomyces stellatus]|uniref:Aste57867_8137 protein n=1 Tax=Aphanomyces stellatus TaxID=120398 RepID=A0A485KJG7_9STRA|nr:hypothetical protein As57867_008107 [Aphanomyces stellatus]VFT85026.1 Aste57867_8137 [Aphanomyces stellatus]